MSNKSFLKFTGISLAVIALGILLQVVRFDAVGVIIMLIGIVLLIVDFFIWQWFS